jgi:hypothetical protein
MLGCRPTDRVEADRQAMLPLPPVTGRRTSTRLPRDHYLRIDSNDYSVHASVIGRRVEAHADLDRVQVWCEERLVANHDRVWAKHQTVSDFEPAAALAAEPDRSTACRRDGSVRPWRPSTRTSPTSAVEAPVPCCG